MQSIQCVLWNMWPFLCYLCNKILFFVLSSLLHLIHFCGPSSIVLHTNVSIWLLLPLSVVLFMAEICVDWVSVYIVRQLLHSQFWSLEDGQYQIRLYWIISNAIVYLSKTVALRLFCVMVVLDKIEKTRAIYKTLSCSIHEAIGASNSQWPL